MTLALLLALCPADPAAGLPANWHGTWAGPMALHGVAGKPGSVPVVLTIRPDGDKGGVTWLVVYGEGKGEVRKDYRLDHDPKRPGRYRLDERNGIVLDARLVGDVLYSQFEVEGRSFTARYERAGGAIRMEITAAKPEKDATGGGAVRGLEVTEVQAAELRRR